MQCPKCAQQTNSTQFCTQCGASFSEEEKQTFINGADTATLQTTTIPQTSTAAKVMKIGRIILGILVVGFFIYRGINDQAIQKNNDALSNYDSGNTDEAIKQLESAVTSSVSDETRAGALVNLGYVYISNNQTEKGTEAFKKALALYKEGTFEHSLISGELALIEKNPKDAEQFYLKAYEKDPMSFQINNALGLFYLDLEEVALDQADPVKALPYMQKAYAQNSEEYVKLNFGITYFFNDKFDDAIGLFKTSNFKNQPYAAFWLGMSYLKKGDEANARDAFKTAKENGAELPEKIQEFVDKV